MIVGACVVELHIEGSQSLKAKRGVVRSIMRRVRNRFDLAVSEVGGQDTWQYAALGLAAVGSDDTRVRAVLERAGDFIEELALAQVLRTDIEVLDLPHHEQPWEPDEEEDLFGTDIQEER
jgi:uncharacterized protein YlxP (DUF503 family)